MTADRGLDTVWGAYEALAEGDVGPFGDLLADAIVWHIPGRNSSSGVMNGREQALAALAARREKSGGTFRSDVHDIIKNESHLVVLSQFSAERKGKRIEGSSVNVFHVNGEGKFADRTLFVEDQEALDAFWS